MRGPNNPQRLLAMMIGALAPAVAAGAPPPAEPPATPTQADVERAYQAGRHPEALRLLTQLLSLRGKAAEGHDRHELLRLKGETLLRMRDPSGAAKAYGEAGEAAADPSAAAVDVATEAVLSRASAGLTFAPRGRAKGRAGGPIDVVAPDGRRRAMQALFAEELAAARPRLEALADGKDLGPVLDALPTIRRLRCLELAATGDVAEVADLLVGLNVRAAGMIEQHLDGLARTVDQVAGRAAAIRTAPAAYLSGEVKPNLARAGLSADDAARLRDVVGSCRAVGRACDELDAAFGPERQAFAAAKSRAGQIGGDAQGLLDGGWRQPIPAGTPGPNNLPLNKFTRPDITRPMRPGGGG